MTHGAHEGASHKSWIINLPSQNLAFNYKCSLEWVQWIQTYFAACFRKHYFWFVSKMSLILVFRGMIWSGIITHLIRLHLICIFISHICSSSLSRFIAYESYGMSHTVWPSQYGRRQRWYRPEMPVGQTESKFPFRDPIGIFSWMMA